MMCRNFMSATRGGIVTSCRFEWPCPIIMVANMTEFPSHSAQPSSAEKIVRLPAVMALTGLSRSSIYAFVEKGSFPKPLLLGERAVGWLNSEINDWIRDRKHDRTISRSQNAPNGSNARLKRGGQQ